jgi:hypothetical protein
MEDRLSHALAAEPIQRPEQNAVELPPGGILEQSRKLLPLIRGFPATLVIDVLAADRMPSGSAPSAQIL